MEQVFNLLRVLALHCVINGSGKLGRKLNVEKILPRTVCSVWRLKKVAQTKVPLSLSLDIAKHSVSYTSLLEDFFSPPSVHFSGYSSGSTFYPCYILKSSFHL